MSEARFAWFVWRAWLEVRVGGRVQRIGVEQHDQAIVKLDDAADDEVAVGDRCGVELVVLDGEYLVDRS
ncbi:MAG: hypothetical protein ACLP0J_17140 [Solirubrobacteraceae bacterium]|jgi:hypothetical protein